MRFAGNKVGVRGIMSVANALRFNRNLEEVLLSGNRCGDEGANSIACALTQNDALRVLALEGDRALPFLPPLLKILCCLSQSIAGAADALVRDNGATRLAQALEENSSLKTLDLRGERHFKLEGIFIINIRLSFLNRHIVRLQATCWVPASATW